MSNWFKKLGADAILSAIFIPVLFWFAGFVVSSYTTFAEVDGQKETLKEIKEDVKFIRQYLLENK